MEQEGDYIGACRLPHYGVSQVVSDVLDEQPTSWPQLIHEAFENSRKLGKTITLYIQQQQLGSGEEVWPLCVIHPDGEVKYVLDVEDDYLDDGFDSILSDLRQLIEKEKGNG